MLIIVGVPPTPQHDQGVGSLDYLVYIQTSLKFRKKNFGGGRIIYYLCKMRLLLISILLLFTTCKTSSPQRHLCYQVVYYPNVYSSENTVYEGKMEITVLGDKVVFREEKHSYIVTIGKFKAKVPLEGGGYLKAYEASSGKEELAIGFAYSKSKKFLSIQLKRGYSILVFLINPETKSL